MAWPTRRHFDELIRNTERRLQQVRIVRLEIGSQRALIDVEGLWGNYRIILSEIHRPDGSLRYAYYVLDNENRLVVGFDNSSDVQALKMRYGDDWREHLHEEIPHSHDSHHELRLTGEINVFRFFDWLQTNFTLTKTQ